MSPGEEGRSHTLENKEEDDISSSDGKMKLLILANTLPILLESTDQGPLSIPQLYSPSFHCSCSLAQESRHVSRDSLGDHTKDMCHHCDGKAPGETVRDSVTFAETLTEADEFVEEIQKKVNDKICFLTRLEEKLIAMKSVEEKLRKMSQENEELQRQLGEITQENKLLHSKVRTLEVSNSVMTSGMKELEADSTNSPSQCCKETCKTLKLLLQDLKDERKKFKLETFQTTSLSRNQRNGRGSNGLISPLQPVPAVSDETNGFLVEAATISSQQPDTDSHTIYQPKPDIILTRSRLAIMVAILAVLSYLWLSLTSISKPKYPI